MPDRDSIVEAVRFQARGVRGRSLASPLYAALLDAVLDDVDGDGPCWQVLRRSPDVDPIPDALVLRFLGGVHRLVLRGEAPALERWFPTAGGSFSPGDEPGLDLVDAVATHAEQLVADLHQPVQTNEVGRCAALAVGFTFLLREHGLPLRLVELGTSAGLNLRWDRWRYESGSTSWGDAGAPLRFDGNYREPYPDVAAPLGPADAVVERLGVDRSPIDPTTAEGRLLLRSFVWPDQLDRHRRLDAALAAAVDTPAAVVAADAAEFVAGALTESVAGVTTVVFHSIVWQYLSAATRSGVVSALADAGTRATPDAPVAWLRMEPGADLTERPTVTVTTWPGGDTRVLAVTGFHGHPVRNVG